ncbi:MAG TPA: hypothetical protein VGC10_06800 [Sphingomonas sp.]
MAHAQMAAPTTSAPQAAGGPGATPLAQGATVYDPGGGTVGAVQSIDGDMVVLATARSKVQLPRSSFAMGPQGPVIGMTAAQVDQAAAQAAPQATPAAKPAAADVVKGAAVADIKGGAVGIVDDVDTRFATLTLVTGGKVRLPVTAFGAGANGSLRVAMTAAQLSAAAGAAPPGASSGGM